MRGYRLAIGLTLCAIWVATSFGQTHTALPEALIVVDADGKETTVARWRFSAGAENLPWSGDAKNKAPQYLAFRDDGSTAFVNGIVTYIPLTALEKLVYDDAKKSVTAVVRAANKEVTIKGTTKYKGINKLTLEGESDLKGLGKAAVKHYGGQPKGIAAIRFPAIKGSDPVEALPRGRKAMIAADDKEKSKHIAVNLAALYKIGPSAKTMGAIWFKSAVKVDLENVARMRRIQSDDKKSSSIEFEVTLKDGAKHSLILNDSPTIEGAAAKLVGLYGRADEGWKLIPLHAISELTLE